MWIIGKVVEVLENVGDDQRATLYLTARGDQTMINCYSSQVSEDMIGQWVRVDALLSGVEIICHPGVKSLKVRYQSENYPSAVVILEIPILRALGRATGENLLD
jgi:hypothetical protein